MNDYDKEIPRFSMDDDDEYDDIDEETIERDEEGEPYDDEGYDDEGYDEEAEGDEYADEEGYDDEAYDEEPEAEAEGYGDDYYDDRLSKVLDEIAEIKRGISAPAVVPQQQQQQPQQPQQQYMPPMPPQYIYPQQPAASSEVTMYNEISRLRDELSKTQNSQTLHLELQRMRSEFEREKRDSDNRHADEIRRLNEKIDDLLKNAEGPQEDDYRPAISAGVSASEGRIENNNSGLINGNLESLLGINEAILRTTKDTDARLQGQISEIKKQLASMPDLTELGKSISALRKSMKSTATDETSVFSKIMTELEGLHRAVVETAPKSSDPVVLNADMTTLIKQLYHVKAAVGLFDESSEAAAALMISLLDETALAKYVVSSKTTSLQEKLTSVFTLVDKVEQAVAEGNVSAHDILAVVLPINGLVDAVGKTKLTRASYDDLLAYSETNPKLELSVKQRDQVERYLRLLDKSADASIDDYLVLAPEIITEKNIVQNNIYKIENDIASSKFMEELMSDAPSETRLSELFEDLKTVQFCQIFDFPTVAVPSEFVPESLTLGESVLQRLDEIKAVLTAGVSSDSEKDPTAEETATAVQEDGTDAASDALMAILPEFDAIKEQLGVLTKEETFNGAVDELRNNYVDIANRIIELSETVQLAATNSATAATVSETSESVAGDTAHAVVTQTVDYSQDFEFIKDKLQEQDSFLDELVKLREEVEQALSKATETTDTVAVSQEGVAKPSIEEISAQFDKLYEDVAALLVTEDGLPLSESIGVRVDSIKDAVAPLSEDVAAIRDNVQIMSDNVGLKVDTLTDTVLPLSEDIAAIRENVQTMSDNVGVKVDTLNDSVAPLSEDIATIRDNVQALIEIIGADVSGEELEKVQNGVAELNTQIKQLTEKDTEARLQEITTSVDSLAEEVKNIADVGITSESIDDLREHVQDVRAQLDVITQNTDLAPVNDRLDGISASIDSVIDILSNGLTDNGVTEVRDIVVKNNDDAIVDRSAIKDDVARIRELVESSSDLTVADSENITAILQDVGDLFTRLEESAATAAENKAAILGQIDTLKDELHQRELNESLAAQGVDQGLGDALTKEISSMTERLTALEGNTQQITDTANANVTALIEKLDELSSALGDKHSVSEVQGEQYDIVAEILSLREDIKAARIVDQNDVTSELEAVKNELAAISSNSILDEIRMMRDDVAALRDNPVVVPDGEPTNGELNMLLNEIVSLRDEVQAFRDEVVSTESHNETAYTQEEVPPQNDESINMMLDELSAMRVEQNTLNENIDELKNIISRRTTLAPENPDEAVAASSELNVVLSEIINLKNDIDQLDERVEKARMGDLTSGIDELKTKVDNLEQSAVSTESDAFVDQLTSLREEFSTIIKENEEIRRQENEKISAEISAMRESIESVLALSLAPTQAESGETSYAALIEEIKSLKEEVSVVKTGSARADSTDVINALRGEIDELKDLIALSATTTSSDEITALREEIATMSSSASMSNELLDAVNGLKDQILSIKQAQKGDEDFGILEDLTTIKTDVRTLKEEPDLGVMSEILALRDEFQSLREQIEDVKNIAKKTDASSDEMLLDRINSLNEQVNAVYTSVDEMKADVVKKTDEQIAAQIHSLRDQLFAISMANVNDAQSGETTYESYNNIILDEISALRDEMSVYGSNTDFSALTSEFEDVKRTIADRTSNLDQITRKVESIDLDALQSANSAVMSELADLRQELQNQREADVTTLNFMSELARLVDKQSRYISSVADSSIADDIASLKAELVSTDRLSGEIAQIKDVLKNTLGNDVDNRTIMKALSELKAKIDSEPGKDNDKLVAEIARLNQAVAQLAEKDGEVAASSDGDLSQSLEALMSELTEIAGLAKPTSAKTKKKTSAKPKAKTATKAVQPSAQIVIGDINDDYAPEEYDVADRLAQQITNRLVTGVNSEQLTDKNTSKDRVERIVINSLPQEFEAVGLNDHPERVRRLAARLVLDKILARLGK